jgi:hypothetical protein
MQRFIIFFIFIISTSAIAQTLTNQSINSRLFLYSSDLPITLEKDSQIIRKHIIDILLANEKFDLMLSEIPDQLVKAKTPQFVFKYKIRTKSASTYDISLFLIDIDKLSIKKSHIFQDIKRSTFLSNLRKNVFLFFSNKKLTTKQKKEFNKRTQKKIKTIGRLEKRSIKNTAFRPSEVIARAEESVTSTAQNKNINKKLKTSIQKGTKKIENGSIWNLLRDDDVDIPWLVKKSKTKSFIKSLEKKISTPFNEISSIKNYDEKLTPLTYHRFHISYKYALRQLEVTDIIDTDIEYHSVIGFSIEWLNYSPRFISRFLYKLSVDFDTPLETTPVQLEGHFNMTSSIGYRYSNRGLIGLSYDIDKMNFPNLNAVSSTVSANSFTVYWLDIDYMYIRRNYNLAVSLGTLLNSKNSGKDQTAELRATDDFKGNSLNFKLRYYMEDKFKGDIQLWMGFQYKKYYLTRTNSSTDTKINSDNFIYHIGTFF